MLGQEIDIIHLSDDEMLICDNFLWISILPYLPTKLIVCNMKNVSENYCLKSHVLLCQECVVVQELASCLIWLYPVLLGILLLCTSQWLST